MLPITANGKWAWNTFSDTHVSLSQLWLPCQHTEISTATEQDSHYAHANLRESSHWPLAQDKGEEGRVFLETLLVLPLYILYLADPPSHGVSGEMSQCKTSIRMTAHTTCCAALTAVLSQGLAVAEENICTSTEAIKEVLEPS